MHLEQGSEGGVLGAEVVLRLAPLRDGGAMEDDDVEEGVQHQDSGRRYARHVQQHRLRRPLFVGRKSKKKK